MMRMPYYVYHDTCRRSLVNQAIVNYLPTYNHIAYSAILFASNVHPAYSINIPTTKSVAFFSRYPASLVALHVYTPLSDG